MTTIIAIEHEDRVYMGADSMQTWGWEGVEDRTSKLICPAVPQGMVIGITGSKRYLDLIRYCLEIPFDPTKSDYYYNERYVVREFIPAVRKVMQDNGYVGKDDEKDNMPGQILMGLNGRIYWIMPSLNIVCPVNGVMAVGSGREYALGALAAMPEDTHPESKISRALNIAAQFDRATAPPFTVVCS